MTTSTRRDQSGPANQTAPKRHSRSAARLRQLLNGVQVEGPRSHDPTFQVFGLRWQPSGKLDYTTLDDALESKVAEVTETSEHGEVPTLRVVNSGDRMVFLIDGEELIGAKQNRVLNLDILVAPRSEQPIPVSCVEHGRWAYRTRRFNSLGTMAHASLRAMMSDSVRHRYYTGAPPSADQGEVWAEVDRKLTSLASHSPSHALHQAYRDRTEQLKTMLDVLPAPAGCHGAAFAIGGRIAGAELFDKPETLARFWPKLLRCYGLDALEARSEALPPLTAESVSTWVRSAAAAPVEAFRSPGVGTDMRFAGAGFVGASLVVGAQPLHVELFASA